MAFLLHNSSAKVSIYRWRSWKYYSCSWYVWNNIVFFVPILGFQKGLFQRFVLFFQCLFFTFPPQNWVQPKCYKNSTNKPAFESWEKGLVSIHVCLWAIYFVFLFCFRRVDFTRRRTTGRRGWEMPWWQLGMFAEAGRQQQRQDHFCGCTMFGERSQFQRLQHPEKILKQQTLIHQKVLIEKVFW